MEPGTLVGGRFRIEPFAARGGMGTVHRALDLETTTFVALKTIDDDPRFGERFARERRLLAALDHPGIVRFVAAGSHEGRPFLAMEWVDGCDLSEALSRGPLDVRGALELCSAIADALQAAHARGVVHRDVKPKNLMLVGGAIDAPRLTDFGIARQGEATRSLTQLGTAVGTPGFMAPEQVEAATEVDARADVFALGCVLFTCVTGSSPYAAESPFASMTRVVAEEPPRIADRWPDAPRALDEVCAALMTKNREGRPRDGAEAGDALRACLRSIGAGSWRFEPRAHLGRSEQRFATAVFVDLTSATRAASSDAETLVGPSHALEPGARAWLRGFGKDPLVLGPTTFAVLFEDAGPPTDVAARAIGCALGLGPKLSTHRTVVVTAPRDGAYDGLREIAERAEALLRALDPAAAASAVFVDDTTASLAGCVFSFVEGARGAFRIAPSITGETVEPGRASPLFGRARELDLLELTAREVFTDRAARAVLIEGALGAGKTRLTEELLMRIRRDHPRARLHRRRPESAGIGGNVALVQRDDPLFARVRRDVETGPTVLFVDDLRLADRASLDALAALTTSLGEAPLMLIGALRTEDRGSLPRLWHDADVLEVRLPPLGRLAVDEAIRFHLGDVDASVAARIHAGAEGNALRLVEMLRAAKRGEPGFPASVVSLAMAKLKELDEPDRALLRAASVFGTTFWVGAVARLLDGRRVDDTERIARGLTQRGFLTQHASSRFDGEVELSFKHPVLREAAYASLVAEDRALAHRLAADWLSQRGELETAVVTRHRGHVGPARS